MKYEEWLRTWLNNYVKPTTKIQTYNRYLRICELHIIPCLGEVDLFSLSVIDLQSFVSSLIKTGNHKTGKELSPNYVNLVISVLQNSLQTAYTVGLIPCYEANKIRRPKLREKQVDCFTTEEQKLLEDFVLSSNKDKFFGIVLCLYTGLRIGELLALTWQDINFEKGVLTVSKTCYELNLEGTLCRISNKPKSDNSKRVIPLPKQIVSLLKACKKRSKCEYVVSSKGKPLYIRSYQRSFELILKKLGLPHKGFHALRHTFATRALECGMDVKSLSEILGHKNATLTLNRYTHSLMEHKAEMMNRLGKLL